MQQFDYFSIARALHVIAVVLWIGGVAFVTTVLIPSLKQNVTPEQRLKLFETLEGRFSLQAKITTLVTGLSGFYMLSFMAGWDRYLDPDFWWMHLMTLVWLLFTVVLFIAEPLFLHRWFHTKASADSSAAFNALHRMHWLLLLISLLAVFGAVTGAHGLQWF